MYKLSLIISKHLFIKVSFGSISDSNSESITLEATLPIGSLLSIFAATMWQHVVLAIQEQKYKSSLFDTIRVSRILLSS